MKRTAWFRRKDKPRRLGKYEGRSRNRNVFDVHWRKLPGESKPDWYTFTGYLGPFALWKAADELTSWRGLTTKDGK